MTPDEIRTAITYANNLLKHLQHTNASKSLIEKTTELITELRMQLALK